METIGWKEKIDFVDFGIRKIYAKVDTGARTSVLHCSKIELIKKYRKNYVKFVPLDENFRNYAGKEFILPFHKEKKVKNSFGQEENRFIVQTTVKMFGKLYEMEISLRDRSDMEFPMLLGRSFIRQKFVVDVSKANLSYKQHVKQQKKL